MRMSLANRLAMLGALPKLPFIFMRGGGGAPTTVSGTSPLTLAGAKAGKIKSLVQYGKCSQADTPTPSNPVDIVCNNGALKWDSVNGRIYADGTPEVLTVSADGQADQTASVSNLLAVGSSVDTQEIIGGTVTRKCGVLVLDGSEAWQIGSSNYKVYYLQISDALQLSGAVVLCSHYSQSLVTTYASMPDKSLALTVDAKMRFKNSDCVDVNEWEAHLSTLYAAGTPVIVVYPLATPTTESVAGQHLNTAAGDNAVCVAAAVSGIELDVQYYGGD